LAYPLPQSGDSAYSEISPTIWKVASKSEQSRSAASISAPLAIASLAAAAPRPWAATVGDRAVGESRQTSSVAVYRCSPLPGRRAAGLERSFVHPLNLFGRFAAPACGFFSPSGSGVFLPGIDQPLLDFALADEFHPTAESMVTRAWR
jgi:hypothetical protein